MFTNGFNKIANVAQDAYKAAQSAKRFAARKASAKGFKNTANASSQAASAAKGMFETAGEKIKGAWTKAQPHLQEAGNQLKSPTALKGLAAGAAGGAVVGATSKDEYGRMRGLDGAIGGALKGGAVGAVGGATYNKYRPAGSTANK